MLFDTIETSEIAKSLYFLGYATSEFNNSKDEGHKKNVAVGILTQTESYRAEIPLQIRARLEREHSLELSRLEKECKDFLKSLKK